MGSRGHGGRAGKMGHLRDEQHGKGMVVHMLRVAWEARPVVVTELRGGGGGG